jgi:hypothetical protein
MKTIAKTSLLVALIGLSFSSCRKTTTSDSDTSSAKDNALAESTYDDANDIADQAAKGTLNLRVEAGVEITSTCANYTYDSTSNPRILTIDFGSTNCLCSDGNNRRGKIIVTHTGRYRDPGTIITIGFNDYYVNDNHIEGTRVVTNNGFNANNNISFSVVVNGTISKADGSVITWTSTRTREWIAGYETIHILSDDVYSVSGNAISPLIRKVACHQFVQGQLRLDITGKAERIIDFGAGDCDNAATVTINGVSHSITLH